MANTTQNSPNGFTALSKSLYKLFVGILIVGVIAFLMSLLSSVAYTKLPQKWLDVLASPFTWITQNPLLALAIFIIFLLLIAIFYLMSRSSGNIAEASQTVRVEVVPVPPVPTPASPAPTPKLLPSDQELATVYCNRLNKGSERLMHDGIPAGLVDRRVKLEDVFIPLRFYRLDAPRDIFPYIGTDLAHIRKGREQVAQQGGDIRPYNRIIELARQEGDFKPDKTIDIAALWQCMTPNEPMAFIEGIPGMGKSTLLTRIMLYMARRVQNIADPDMPQLNPLLIPVFVSLKKYATSRNTPSNKLSLLDFIKTDIQERFHDRDEVDALVAFIERQLKSGDCLVLIDGIDEVSDPTMRQVVQVAIKDFIEQHSRQEKASPTYNRFLITSRVAGYDKKGFEDYPHYLIARLTL